MKIKKIQSLRNLHADIKELQQRKVAFAGLLEAFGENSEVDLELSSNGLYKRTVVLPTDTARGLLRRENYFFLSELSSLLEKWKAVDEDQFFKAVELLGRLEELEAQYEAYIAEKDKFPTNEDWSNGNKIIVKFLAKDEDAPLKKIGLTHAEARRVFKLQAHRCHEEIKILKKQIAKL